MKEKLISFFEYEKKPLKEIFSIESDIDDFYKYLEKENLQNIFNINRTYIQAKNHVGVIVYKNYQFEILPKLLRKENENDSQILKNLLFMLSYTEELDISDVDLAKLTNNKNPFLEILIGIYAEFLLSSLLRFIPKNYITEENKITYLKGKLIFSEQIKLDIRKNCQFFCEYDEFSENNLLNQTFYYVSKVLYKISKSVSNQKNLKKILNIYSEVDLKKIKIEDIKNFKLSRNQRIFEKTFSLAKMFLKNSSIDLNKKEIKTISLIFDMNKLFEEFIYQLINKNQKKINGLNNIKYQKSKKLIKSSIDLLNNIENNNKFRNTYTDILLNFDNNTSLILDTKYKINSGERDDFSNSNSDLYQMMAYKALYRECNTQVLLLYPKDIKNFIWKHEINDDLERRNYIFLSCIDLHIDISSDIKKDDSKILKQLNNCIEAVKQAY